METKNSIDQILNILLKETKKISKKKKKGSIVAIQPITRSMGAIFGFDVAVSIGESVVVDNLKDLKQQVHESKDLNEFLKNIIIDYDVRYKNRKAAVPLVKIEPIIFIEKIKPEQKIEKQTVVDWEESINNGNRPFIIIRLNNEIDGHHKFQAYKNLGFDEVPILFERDLVEFYNLNKPSKSLNEGSAIKPITKKFNHLKWNFDDFQKQFLDDFIGIDDSVLRDSDFEYAAKRLKITVQNLKSIKNTYRDKTKTPSVEDIKKYYDENAGAVEQEAIRQINDVRDFPKDKSGRFWSNNPNPEFRNKSLKQIEYEDELTVLLGGKFVRVYDRSLPDYIFEWLMYYLEGSENFKVENSKLSQRLFGRSEKNIQVELLSDSKMSGSLDLNSNKVLKETRFIENVLSEFNSAFGTNFIVEDQSTSENGNIKMMIVNSQTTDGKMIKDKKKIDMTYTDEKRQKYFDARSSMGS